MSNKLIFAPYQNENHDGSELLSDAAYQRGIEINVHQGLSFTGNDGEPIKNATLIHVSGLTERGANDFVALFDDVDTDAATSFFNSLLITLGVRSFITPVDYDLVVIPVPRPNYHKFFLPPYVAMARLGDQMYESLSQEEVVNKLKLDSIPEFALVLFDKNGVSPDEEDYDVESVTQYRIWMDDLTDLINPMVGTEPLDESLGYVPGTYIPNPSERLAFFGAPTNDHVGDADIEAIRDEDERWDEEIANRNPHSQ